VFKDAKIETMTKVEGRKKHATEVGFHSLRHAHITALLENGIPKALARIQPGLKAHTLFDQFLLARLHGKVALSELRDRLLVNKDERPNSCAIKAPLQREHRRWT